MLFTAHFDWVFVLACTQCSGHELLRLLVKGGTLLDRAEALDLQGGARLLDGHYPGVLLALGALLLAHNLAALVLRQVTRLQAAHGLCLAPTEHHSLGHATPCNLAHTLLLHGLHGLH